MKKNSLIKKSAVKRPLAKGAALKSAKNEIPNSKHLRQRRIRLGRKITNKSQTPSTCAKGASASGGKSQTFFDYFNFKNWNLFGIWNLRFGIFKVAGLFVLFAILGFTVWQALLPQSARSKTFPPKADQPRADTFFQTAQGL